MLRAISALLVRGMVPGTATRRRLRILGDGLGIPDFRGGRPRAGYQARWRTAPYSTKPPVPGL